MRALAIGIVCLLASTAAADRPNSIDDLGRGLPKGWKLVRQRDAFTIERTAPVKVAGRYLENEPHYGNVPRAPAANAIDVTLKLRFRVEPAWDAKRHRDATATNVRIGEQMKLARVQHKIDDIPTSKGRPLPRTDAERTRLADYEAAIAKLRGSLVKPPRCQLGAFSIFDDEQTYSQLVLMVEPTTAMREMYAVVELVKRRCR
jgi:hypothetical protein